MPRYHFNVYPDGLERDAEGSECADIYVAHSEAVRMTGEIIRDLGHQFRSGGQWRMEVTDEWEKTLYVVRVSAEEVLDASRHLPGRPSQLIQDTTILVREWSKSRAESFATSGFVVALSVDILDGEPLAFKEIPRLEP